MYCSNCGAPLGENEKFCKVCGASAGSSEMQYPDDSETTVLFHEEEETGRLDKNNVKPADGNIFDGLPFQERQPYVQNNQQTPQQGYMAPGTQDLNENAFYKKFASKGTNSWVITIIVICFFTGATTIVSILEGNILGLFDLIYFVFGILLILRKKWYFTLAVTVYSGVWTLIAIFTAGAATGILALAAGIISTIKLKKINDAYKQYKEHGILPQNVI